MSYSVAIKEKLLFAKVYDDWIFSITKPSCAELFLITMEGGMSYVFRNPSMRLFEIFDMTSFPIDQFFWLIGILTNNGYLLNYDWIFFSVAIWHTPPLDGNWNISIIGRGVGLYYHFGKTEKFNPIRRLNNFNCHSTMWMC